MWTLVLFAYAGIFADGDSMALTHIKGFSSEQVCIAAGNKTKDLVKSKSSASGTAHKVNKLVEEVMTRLSKDLEPYRDPKDPDLFKIISGYRSADEQKDIGAWQRIKNRLKGVSEGPPGALEIGEKTYQITQVDGTHFTLIPLNSKGAEGTTDTVELYDVGDNRAKCPS